MNEKLNLGCGGDILEGWINIDLWPCRSEVRALDISEPLPFEDGTIAAIRAIDCFEHIPHAKAKGVLRAWTRLLKHGGKLTIRCPDMIQQCRYLVNGPWKWETFNRMVFGGQETPGNFHFSGWTKDTLMNTVQEFGLKILSCQLVSNNITPDAATSDNPNLLIEALK